MMGVHEWGEDVWGKIENKSGENAPNGYAEMTVGKIENKSAENSSHCYAEMILLMQGLYPCKDKTIIAIIEDNNRFYFGSNGVRINHECVRKEGLNSGYELCRAVCGQQFHAEAMAIDNWLKDNWHNTQHNAHLHIFGAKACCDNCQAIIDKYNIPYTLHKENIDIWWNRKLNCLKF